MSDWSDGEVDGVHPDEWARLIDACDSERRRRFISADVRAAFLRLKIAGSGLPFSDPPAARRG